MYLDFYNLHLKPFQISTDPRFLWLGEKHEEALAILKYAIRDNRGFLLLTGDVGTGKTTLLNALIENLGDDVHVALVTDPGLAKLDFFNYVADAFELDRTFRSKGQFLIFMKRFLSEVHRQDKQALLIIDESQNLNQKMLEEVRLLSNIEKATTKLINIFFVGQIEFNDIIRRPRNRAIRQRITVNYNIPALSESETSAYIRYRLKVAGCEAPIFTPDAITAVHEFSKGYPRLINIICDQAMLTGYVKEARQIGSAIIAECMAELKIADGMPKAQNEDTPTIVFKPVPEPTPTTPARGAGWRTFSLQSKITAVIAVVLLIVLLLGLEVSLFRSRQENASIEKSVAAVQQTDAEPVPKVPPSDSDPSVSGPATTQLEADAKPDLNAAETISTPSSDSSASTQQPLAEAATDAEPAEKRIYLEDIKKVFGEYPEIHFEHDSNTLDTEAYFLLGLLAQYIRQKPETALVLRGYTDRSGLRTYNLKLAEFRSDMVKTYLVGKGVRADTISTLAIGPDPQGPGGTTVPYDGKRRKVVVEIIAPDS